MYREKGPTLSKWINSHFDVLGPFPLNNPNLSRFPLNNPNLSKEIYPILSYISKN
jgi:hypothetical protein